MKKIQLLAFCMMFMQLAFAQGLKSNLDESCPSPENFEYDCYWEDNEFYVRLVWDKADYESDLDRFEVYKATDDDEFEMIKRIVNVPFMSHYEALDIIEEPGYYYYKVIAIYNDGCESEPVETMIELTAVDENATKNVQIYPNPTSGVIVIKAEMMNGIEVFNALGQTILVKYVENDEVSLDLGSFGSGMYFISILTENGNIVKKINVK
ncbi:MAG: T9SS type A sorting domain-containing protein [Bacteroidales bacterium]|nr:T9SS type A sorting domain-containing protein [Bacteroidales bacterium]